ncbi:MAG: hypothetical protein WBD07_13565 [Vicinamibacterales bacterium]
MRRPPHRQLLLGALLAATIACSDDGGTTPIVTAPSGGIITETFTGALRLNEAASFPFSSASGGSITATLTTFTPDLTLKAGLWVGVWNGTQCTSGVANDSAQGPDPAANPVRFASTVTAFATSAGSWCVRIYDSTGTAPASSPGQAYQIDVTHP